MRKKTKDYSSWELKHLNEEMSSLQREHYRELTNKMTPEKALKTLGVKGHKVPAFETKSQWKKIKAKLRRK